jgi:hypothetical protein
VTVFLGCGFAAKYREGGGNLSVPLQWMLGLRRLKLDAIWLELLPATKDSRDDQAKIDNFQRRMREQGLRYCLLYHKSPGNVHDLDSMRCIGVSKRELLDRLAGPTTLLNLSYSIHPPLLSQFERKIFCDLDPSEIIYWMTKMELGQSQHDEFWTIGLNVNGSDCRLPVVKSPAGRRLQWKTFFPMVDPILVRKRPRPRQPKFTTIGQWYWDGSVEVDGEYPDLSKRTAFEPYLDLPTQAPEAKFELAMNMGDDEVERQRLRQRGWHIVDPHRVARTPGIYRKYLASALGEFTAIKGVDVAWQTGWVSDRAAAFLAMGRPVVTEDTGVGKYLPSASGFRFIHGAPEAANAIKEVVRDWPRFSKEARNCALEIFDSAKNLRTILAL